MLEAKAKYEAGLATAGSKDSAGLVDVQTVGETEGTEVLPAEAQVVPSKGDVVRAPVEDNTKLVEAVSIGVAD